MIIFCIICSLLLLLYSIYKGVYILSIFLVIHSIYEFTAPLSYFYFDDSDVEFSLISHYSDAFTQFFYLNLIFQLFVTYSFFYFYNKAKYNKYNIISIQESNILFSNISLFIFICGIISFYYNAGDNLLLDYSGLTGQVTRFFYYGYSFLPTIALYMIINIRGKIKYYNIFLALLLIAPLCYEIFISSRRQWFAPIIGIYILYILYNKSIAFRNKIIYVCSGVMISLLLLGAQFAMRSLHLGSQANQESLLDISSSSNLFEFFAVSATSFSAWDIFIVHSEPFTNGSQILFTIINSIPFIKLGDILFPSYSLYLKYIIKEVAPMGGFSVIAECLITFGYFGIPIFALLYGYVISKLHNSIFYLFNSISLSYESIYFATISSIFIFKYRSGISDCILSIINFTILYYFIIFLTKYFRINIYK